MPLLVEIKARCEQVDLFRKTLLSLGADFRGEDHQIDTYFLTTKSRLKLRQGKIENTLIHYQRYNQAGPKVSQVALYHPNDSSALKEVLCAALSTSVVVNKRREIYFIDNVKFHIDQVKQLGSFVEIEAIDSDGSIGQAVLDQQCRHYMQVLKVQQKDLLTHSYSDMLLAIANKTD